MQKLEIVKSAVSAVVCIGTSRIVNSIIVNHVETDTIAKKVTVSAGGFVIGSMVADISKRYTDAKIDAIAALVRELTNKTP